MNIIVTFKVIKFRRKKLYMLKCAFLLAGPETSSGGLENWWQSSIPYPSGAKCRCVVAGGNVSIVSRFAVVDFLCLCHWKILWLIVLTSLEIVFKRINRKLRISGGKNAFFVGGHPEWCTPTVAKASSERDWAPAAALSAAFVAFFAAVAAARSALDNFGLRWGFDFRFFCVINNIAFMSGATTLEKSSGPNAYLDVKRTLGLLIRGLRCEVR